MVDTVYGCHQFFTQLRGETALLCTTSFSYPAQQQSQKDSLSGVIGDILLSAERESDQLHGHCKVSSKHLKQMQDLAHCPLLKPN